MNYFLKKYLPIQKNNDRLTIGVNDEFVEVDYDEEKFLLLEKLIDTGISEKEITLNSFYKLLHKNNMLSSNIEKRRNELFLDYLHIHFDNQKLYSTILILGAGAAGSTISYLLAQFGFKSIVIVDNDDVEQSDIEKTMVFRRNHILDKKVNALKEIIKQNFDIEIGAIDKMIKSEDELRAIIGEVNPELVIKAFDPDPIYRTYINKICFEKNIPFVFMAYSFEYLNMGPFYIPGITPCDECYHYFLKDSSDGYD